MALAGVTIGGTVTWLAIMGKALFAHHFGDDRGSSSFISLLLLFGTNLAAEHVHIPDVLAAARSKVTR